MLLFRNCVSKAAKFATALRECSVCSQMTYENKCYTT